MKRKIEVSAALDGEKWTVQICINLDYAIFTGQGSVFEPCREGLNGLDDMLKSVYGDQWRTESDLYAAFRACCKAASAMRLAGRILSSEEEPEKETN